MSSPLALRRLRPLLCAARLAAAALGAAAPLTLAASAAEARVESRFSFAVPEGWDDLTDGATPVQITRLHPALVAVAMESDYLVFAADLQPGPDDRTSFVQGVLLPSGIVISPETLPKIKEAIVKRHEGEGVTVDFRSLVIDRIGDVEVAKAVFALKGEGVDDMRLAYVIPGRDVSALLVYGCTAAQFEKLRPMFERTAQRTTGAEATPRPISAGGRAKLAETAATVAFLVGTGAFLLSRGKKRPRPKHA